MLDRNIQKVTTEVSFGLKSHLNGLKKKKRLKNQKYIYFFKK